MNRSRFYCMLTLFVCFISCTPTMILAQSFLDKGERSIGLNLGVSHPIASGVLQDGAYPWGINLQLMMNQQRDQGVEFELISGVEVIDDYSEGAYLKVPVMVNRKFTMFNILGGNGIISAYSGLGYVYHHTYTMTDGIVIKDQHNLGINGGILLDYILSDNWMIGFRTGVFHSFTHQLEAYFGGTSIRSRDAFNYTTWPLLISINRKLKNGN